MKKNGTSLKSQIMALTFILLGVVLTIIGLIFETKITGIALVIGVFWFILLSSIFFLNIQLVKQRVDLSDLLYEEMEKRLKAEEKANQILNKDIRSLSDQVNLLQTGLQVLHETLATEEIGKYNKMLMQTFMNKLTINAFISILAQVPKDFRKEQMKQIRKQWKNEMISVFDSQLIEQEKALKQIGGEGEFIQRLELEKAQNRSVFADAMIQTEKIVDDFFKKVEKEINDSLEDSSV